MNALVNGPLLRQKAEELAKKLGKDDFVATEGWFQHWKKKENIVFAKTFGEQQEADAAVAEGWLETQSPALIVHYSTDGAF